MQTKGDWRLGSPWKERISIRERKRSQYKSWITHAARFPGLSHQYSNHWATFTKQLPASCHSVYNVTVHFITPLPPYVYDLDTLLHCSLAFSVMAFSATTLFLPVIKFHLFHRQTLQYFSLSSNYFTSLAFVPIARDYFVLPVILVHRFQVLSQTGILTLWLPWRGLRWPLTLKKRKSWRMTLCWW